MLKVHEVFNSFNGEINPFGQMCPMTFLRLSGCNLKCSYCDTDNTIVWKSFEKNKLEELLEILNPLYKRTQCLCITGGEPLFQPDKDSLDMVYKIASHYLNSYIETNGTILIPNKFFGITNFCVDVKMDQMDIEFYSKNLKLLSSSDVIKFPVINMKNVDSVIELIKHLMSFYRPLSCPKIAVSFASESTKEKPDFEYSKQIAFKILEEAPPRIFLNIQMHKLLGLQ